MASEDKTFEEMIRSSFVISKGVQGEDLEVPTTCIRYGILKMGELFTFIESQRVKQLESLTVKHNSEIEKRDKEIEKWRTSLEGRDNELALEKHSNRLHVEKINALTKEVAEGKDEIASAKQQIESVTSKLKSSEAKLQDLQGKYEKRVNMLYEERDCYKSYRKSLEEVSKTIMESLEGHAGKFDPAGRKITKQLKGGGQAGSSHGAVPGTPMLQAKLKSTSKSEARKRKDETIDSDSSSSDEPNDRKQRLSSESGGTGKHHKKPKGDTGTLDLRIAPTTADTGAAAAPAGPPPERPQQRNVSNNLLSILIC